MRYVSMCRNVEVAVGVCVDASAKDASRSVTGDGGARVPAWWLLRRVHTRCALDLVCGRDVAGREHLLQVRNLKVGHARCSDLAFCLQIVDGAVPCVGITSDVINVGIISYGISAKQHSGDKTGSGR